MVSLKLIKHGSWKKIMSHVHILFCSFTLSISTCLFQPFSLSFQNKNWKWTFGVNCRSLCTYWLEPFVSFSCIFKVNGLGREKPKWPKHLLVKPCPCTFSWDLLLTCSIVQRNNLIYSGVGEDEHALYAVESSCCLHRSSSGMVDLVLTRSKPWIRMSCGVTFFVLQS